MIDTEKDNRKLVEKAILVGVEDRNTDFEEINEHLKELEELVNGIGVPVIDKITTKLKKPRAKYYLGSGKAEEIAETAIKQNCDCIVFDFDLSPSQQRNWEKLIKICIIDRREVILDIFANRATTREARLQVELARMEYSLPRLTRAWTHLSRQRGGAKGTRGEGEKQIEIDRRLVQKKIAQLKSEIEEVKKHREIERRNRDNNPIPHGAIVGYTNAGKSSILNILAGSNVVTENKLFATLDPTTRKVLIPPSNLEVLLTDTVGFVRKLPHSLVEAFKSTLEEAVLADFLIIVLDLNDENVEEHWETTLEVLDELCASEKKKIIVFNKVDLQNDKFLKAGMRAIYPDSLFISAKSGEGLDSLKSRIMRIASKKGFLTKLKIAPEKYNYVASAYRDCSVLDCDYDKIGNTVLTVSMTEILRDKYQKFIPEQEEYEDTLYD